MRSLCLCVCGIGDVCMSFRHKNVCWRSVFPKGLAQTGQTPRARGNKEDLCVKSVLSRIALGAKKKNEEKHGSKEKETSFQCNSEYFDLILE